MKIATYNINGINGRIENLLSWLAQAKPDIVCLQELKCENNKFPEKALLEAGYQAIWNGQKSWNGVAILSKKYEIKETRRGLEGEPEDKHSRYLEAFINSIVIGCLLEIPRPLTTPFRQCNKSIKQHFDQTNLLTE